MRPFAATLLVALASAPALAQEVNEAKPMPPFEERVRIPVVYRVRAWTRPSSMAYVNNLREKQFGVSSKGRSLEALTTGIIPTRGSEGSYRRKEYRLSQWPGVACRFEEPSPAEALHAGLYGQLWPTWRRIAKGPDTVPC